MIQTAPAKRTSPKPRPVDVDVEDHIGWACGVAQGVSRAYRFDRGSQEESDLKQTAFLALVRCGRAFNVERVPVGGDTAGAFRGYAHRELQSECRREARRLRNGGTYRTRREQGRPAVVPVQFSFVQSQGTRDDEPSFDITDHRTTEEEPDDDFA